MTVFFVFHGGSGSSKQEYLDAISVSGHQHPKLGPRN